MKSIIKILLIVVSTSNLFAQQSKIDSLYTNLYQLENKKLIDTNLYAAYMKVAYHTQSYNLDSALYFHNNARNIAGQLKDNYRIAYATFQIGNDYSQFGVYDKALLVYDSALVFAQKVIESKNEEESLKGVKLRANIYKSIGYINMVTGDYKTALDVYYKSLKIAEENKDTNAIAVAFNGIGMILENQDQFEKAGVFYKKSYEFFLITKDKRNQAGTLNNIGNIYAANKDYDNASIYFLKALKLNEETGNKVWEATNLGNLGAIEFNLGNYKIALDYFIRALKIKQETNDKFGEGLILLNIANSYIDLKDSIKAEKYALSALEIAKTINAVELLRDSNKSLSTIYYYQNPKKSLDFYMQYIQFRDSIINDENLHTIYQKELQHEFDKKEAALKAEQEKKEAVAQAEKSRQQLFMLLIGAIAIAISIIALVIYRSLSITKKQKQIIEHQKTFVEEKQKEILDSIHYAKRIQLALLTSEKYIQRKLEELIK